MSKDIYPSQLNVERLASLITWKAALISTFTLEKDGKLSAKLYDKHDYFDIHIANVISTLISIPIK